MNKQSAHLNRSLEAIPTKIPELEGHFQVIFDNLPDGMVIINPTENGEGPWFIEYCNQAFCEMNGFDCSELIGKDIRVVSNETAIEVELQNNSHEKIAGGPDDGTTHRREFYQRLKQGPLRIEEIHKRKDGSNFHIQASSCLVTLGDQERVLGIDRDITEHKQADEKLFASEERYRRLFEAAQDGILILDADTGVVEDVNPFLLEMLGFTSKELRGEKIWDLGFFKDITANKANFRELQHEKYVRYENLPLETANGRRFDVEFVSNVYQVDHRKVVQCNIRDITERIQSEKALARERYQIDTLLDNIPDFIYFKDIQSRFVRTSTAQARAFGLSNPADVVGKTDFDFFTQDHAQTAFEQEQQIIQTGIPMVGMIEKETWPDHQDTWALTTKMPLHDEKGDIVGTFGISRDITEIKKAQEALALQTEELRLRSAEIDRLYRATGSLLSSMPFEAQALAKTIVEVVLQDFTLANCSVFIIRKDSNHLDRLATAGLYSDQVRKIPLTVDGAGLIPKAIRSGQVINTPDVRADPVYMPSWEGAQAELVIPLKVSDHVIGAIDVQSSELGAFKPDDERLLSIFSERAALAIEGGRLNEELERRVLQLTSLRTVDMAISSNMDMNLTLGVLLDQLAKHLAVDAADVLLVSLHLDTFKYASEQGFRTQGRLNTTFRIGDGLASRALREKQIILIHNLGSRLHELQRSDISSNEGFSTYMGIPLIAKGQVKGVLEIFQRSPFELNPEQRAFLEMLAGQAAIAIDNAQLFENLQDSNFELMMAYDETIEGWSRAMDLRDKETEGHTIRVTELTMRLAASMGLGAEEQAHIRRGTLLHDIGKIGVPDDILHKPGVLTAEEWVIMRQHPQLAYDMLVPIIYLHPSIDIPYCHHEKWDGTGYPRGLKGVQIPLGARIFAVVDVWDALTNDRPYRMAWPEDKVRQYIREQAGLHFDPHIVEIFLSIVLN